MRRRRPDVYDAARSGSTDDAARRSSCAEERRSPSNGPVVQITKPAGPRVLSLGTCGAERIGWNATLAVFAPCRKQLRRGHCASRTSDRAYVDVLLDDPVCRAILPNPRSVPRFTPPDSLFSILCRNLFDVPGWRT